MLVFWSRLKIQSVIMYSIRSVTAVIVDTLIVHVIYLLIY